MSHEAVSRRTALGALGLGVGALGLGPGWHGVVEAAEPEARTLEWPREVSLLGAAPLTREALMSRSVVLGFSSATCGYCLRQDAHLQVLHQKSGKEVLVLGVSTDARDEDVLALARRHGWTFAWTREHDKLAALFDRRRILPRTYLVGRGGVLLRSIPGEMFESDVLELPDIARRAV